MARAGGWLFFTEEENRMKKKKKKDEEGAAIWHTSKVPSLLLLPEGPNHTWTTAPSHS